MLTRTDVINYLMEEGGFFKEQIDAMYPREIVSEYLAKRYGGIRGLGWYGMLMIVTEAMLAVYEDDLDSIRGSIETYFEYGEGMGGDNW